MKQHALNPDKIGQYILEHIEICDKHLVSKTVDAFSVSHTTVYNYLKKLIKDGFITKSTKNTFPYELVEKKHFSNFSTAQTLEEDEIYNENILPFLNNVSADALVIWKYAFTEIMNNAIDHSKSKCIKCIVVTNAINTKIIVIDDGIGIFKNICEYYLREFSRKISLDDAIMELLAGKLTTDKSKHSGEGIFFTSRSMDKFLIFSDNKIFVHDAFSETILNDKNDFKDRLNVGTAVMMELSNKTNKKLQDVFNMYSDVENGFVKTQIPIAHTFSSGYPVSRSEARRLGECIKRFKEVILDFSGVANIGQAFTHELFVVFQKSNPDIKLLPVNMSENVNAMISRVTTHSAD